MLKADPRFFDFEKTVDRSLSLLQVYDLFKKFFGPVKGAENKAEDNLGDDSGESPDEDPLDEDPLEVRINKILNARKPIEGGGSTPAQTVKTNKTFEEARAGAKKLLETMFNK
jgi:hypothetical protein